MVKRIRILIQGQVQGVGFRPHVYRAAKQLDLTGWVKNTPLGVLIEVQGERYSEFPEQLMLNLPPLALVHEITITLCNPIADEFDFEIAKSIKGPAHTRIAPDTGLCRDCLDELFNPESRYYRYPFLNCTQCGPRFTITRTLPYDRMNTAMASFPLCSACQNDYEDPLNRRYHAQPTACPTCGPGLSLSIEKIAEKIHNGDILALKGLGGYQLICDAAHQAAVLRLRRGKKRIAKPFALMTVNVASAEKFVDISAEEAELLTSPAHPIVLLKKKRSLDASIDHALAPDLSHLGIMMPDTPLHYLLLNALCGYPKGTAWLTQEHAVMLVVTSANCGGDPLIITDDEAMNALQDIADCIVSYNRPIITHADDSVMRIIDHAPLFIRRARGFVPIPVELPYAIRPVLALGSHFKNTFCITRDREAFVSQHIGSLSNPGTIACFHESLQQFLKFLGVKPECVVSDQHPDGYTRILAENWGIASSAVQHHHAHLAAVVAEYHIEQAALGLVLDGYGYGEGGAAWGGELFLLNPPVCEHLGSFYPLQQPGGDIAAREPWRMGAAALYALGRGDEIERRYAEFLQAGGVRQLLEKRVSCYPTSSCGRLFDAASALLGIQTVSHYESHAATRLESLVTAPQVLASGWRIENNCFNMLPTLAFLADLHDPVLGANLFHGTLIAGLTAWIEKVAQIKKLDTVLFSGGCFMNKVLAEGLRASLKNLGIQTFLPRALPPNDGGISLGQAWIAGIR